MRSGQFVDGGDGFDDVFSSIGGEQLLVFVMVLAMESMILQYVIFGTYCNLGLVFLGDERIKICTCK